MGGDTWLLMLLQLETRQVAPDNNVVLTLKPGDKTQSRHTKLIIVVGKSSGILTASMLSYI